MRSIVGALIGCLICGSALAQGAPSAGQQDRDIKALSSQEEADLLAGRGMGLARAGELNHYPGPSHVLELRDRLGLTAQQGENVRASFDRMTASAKPLGRELVERERRLDAGFRDALITPATVGVLTGEIAAIQGRLRAVHLAAHVEMHSLLTPDQIATYDKLRGYGDNVPAAPVGHMHR